MSLESKLFYYYREIEIPVKSFFELSPLIPFNSIILISPNLLWIKYAAAI